MKKLGKLISVFGYVDYLVSAACLGYGIYTSSVWFIVGGLIGLVLAWMQPAEYLRAKLETKFLRKRQGLGDMSSVVQDEAEFVPHGLSTPGQGMSFIPRARYVPSVYFSGKGEARRLLPNPRNLTLLVTGTPARESFGIKPGSLDWRKG